ncbi:unnamed protein product [Cyprideis torosa]|uniref:Uncharacterized protein n=1 Tax=Cyprideis torosa TaxID=163714 RepID=A0A7R8W9A0_9CRUS|nr:unnamed protein product [Cyprideis torosa]CAG0885119.1 unnamed protein product [Cyprideis torosa]
MPEKEKLLKVFKKTAPNGKITVYLGKRDYIDHLSHVDPIDGVVVVEDDYLKGRKIFGQLMCRFRYGRETDEMMGLQFSKEMILVFNHIQKEQAVKNTPLQEKLLRRLGSNAYPFTFEIHPNAPTSVTLQAGDEKYGKPLGVEYELKAWVADTKDEKPHRRSSVSMAVRKVQFAPSKQSSRLPSALVSKGFALSPGKLNLEVTLDREIFYHGDQVVTNVIVNNNSRKIVKGFKVSVIQHCEVTIVNAQFTREIASITTRDGCPITPGASYQKQFTLIPTAASINQKKDGVALDGRLKDEDVNLASSTLVPDGQNPNSAFGIIVSYSIRVRLNCGSLGGELVADLPFKLLHPAPGGVPEKAPDRTSKKRDSKPPRRKRSEDARRILTIRRKQALDRIPRQRSQYAAAESDDDDPTIVFEDFKRMRSVDEPGIEAAK